MRQCKEEAGWVEVDALSPGFLIHEKGLNKSKRARGLEILIYWLKALLYPK